MTTFDIQAHQIELAGQSPGKILRAALAAFDNIALSFSGAEDVVLIDMALQIRPDMQIFSLDTGRLHPETYRFIEKVREHYGIKIECLSPNASEIADLVTNKGWFSFYNDGHQECCNLRKVEPLKGKLFTLDAWITGQRKDQSLETRQDLVEVEIDQAFSIPEQNLIKFNPLLNWSSRQVWDYIEAYALPYNSLHKQGFISIGCEPCTRAILPNQHERQGRWWWESEAKKECGLHAGNLK